jgi:hypothetical protein
MHAQVSVMHVAFQAGMDAMLALVLGAVDIVVVVISMLG